MKQRFVFGATGVVIAAFALISADVVAQGGNAAAMKWTRPSGLVSLRMSMCSASQPSSRAITLAMRRA